MLALDRVTLVCVDDVETGRAARMLRWQAATLRPAAALLFTSRKVEVPESWGVVVVQCRPVRSLDDYSMFVARDLVRHVVPGSIETSHVLIEQCDGHAVRPEAWDPEWLTYDYIGASWRGINTRHVPRGCEVGNGGFSLRSTRFLRAGAELVHALREVGPIIEDVYLCLHHRRWMEAQGVRYAPHGVAGRFSTEAAVHGGQFGYHRRAGTPCGLPARARPESWELHVSGAPPFEGDGAPDDEEAAPRAGGCSRPGL